MRIPAAHRLPNPPPIFVGRAQEADRLRRILERGPVGVLAGPRGAGKTALVSTVLCSRPDIWYLACPRDVGLNWVVETLCRVMGMSESTTDETLDAADAAGRVWVVDDAERLGADAVTQMLDYLARYARQSTWVLVCTDPPVVPAIAEQILTLGPLDDAAVKALVGAQPDIDAETAAFIISAAGGWPGVIRGLMSPEPAGNPLQDLPPAVVRRLAKRAPLEPVASTGTTAGLDALERALQVGQGEALLHRHAARWLAEGQTFSTPAMRSVRVRSLS
jgi:hypothetical protein